MRTIKFRGQRFDNREWVYGFLYQIPLPSGVASVILTTNNIHEDNSIKPKYHLAFTLWVDLFPVKPETIGLFTGLHDQNGEEIYEGDIINCRGYKTLLEVRFVRGVFSFLWGGDLNNEFLSRRTCRWTNVVGNIHDNPELLSLSEQA